MKNIHINWKIFLIEKCQDSHNFLKYFCHVLSILDLLFTPLEFLTSVLADGFSLESEWQQVSSSLQDSSQDTGRS